MIQPVVLAHESFGHGPQKVLVLHSWVGNAKSFDATKPHLDVDAFTYVFADLRGYGDSRGTPGEYNSTEAAHDAYGLAEHLGWERFHVVGHSMSGMIAQRMMLLDSQRPSPRLQSVVAVTPVIADGYPADPDTRDFLWAFVHDLEVATQGMDGLTGGRLHSRWAQSAARANIDSSSADAMRGYYSMWLDEDFRSDLERAKPATPLRVIGGRQDLPGFQEGVYRESFLAWKPDADLHFITDAGHFPMVETPIYLATLVEEFLAEHSD